MGSRLLGWHTVCAVELAPFPRGVLLARQRDGFLPRFPIWDDVRTFDGRPWRGRVDLVSGGFPCQPFSSAARGRNVAIDLWPHMLRIVGEVEPSHVLAENVKREPIERACADLHRLGYRCRFGEITAAALGAPHSRPRWWLVADSDGEGESRRPLNAEVARLRGVAAVALPWENEPGDLGVHDGVADRMDRLAALGNGQVPAMVVEAWSRLRK